MKIDHRLLLGAFLFFAESAFSQEPEDSSRMMETVVVTGQHRPQSLKQSVYHVRVIGQERIRLRAASDLVTILNNEAGVRFSTDQTLGETNISLMGMSGQNVKILLDGVPLVDRGSVKQSLSQIDINSIERIEIVEGPMSVTYGTDALAGVINIITRKAKTPSFTVSARVHEETTGNNYSPFSYDGVHQESVRADWNGAVWSASGSFSRNIFGGWTGKASLRAQEAKPKDQYFGGIGVGFKKGKIRTWYRLDYLNEDIYSAGALNPNNYRAKDQHYYTDRVTHLLQTEWWASGDFRLSGSLSYQDYRRQTETYTVDYVTGINTPSLDPGEQDLSKFSTFFFRSVGQWSVSDKVSIQPGVEIKHDRTSGERIEGRPSISDYSVFASAEIQWPHKLKIRPGLRFSKNSVYSAPPVIPSIHLKYDIGESAMIRLSYARGFRAPILRELYFYYFDANHSIQGNPDLKAETSDSYQASVSKVWINKNKISLNTSLSGFYNRFQNQITLAAASGAVYSYFNIDRYKTTGLSLDAELKWNSLSANLGALFIGRYNPFEAEKTMESLPEFTWSPEISSNISYVFRKLKTTAALFYKYTGRLPSYASAPNPSTGENEIYLTRLSDYQWADFSLSKELPKGFTVQAGVRNIFDVKRINNSTVSGNGTHTAGGPMLLAYGRSYFVGVLFQWTEK